MLLDVCNLDVAYGDAPALWDISLAIDAGRIVSVIGPNGAGKSTLINTIAGVLRPTGGQQPIDKRTKPTLLHHTPPLRIDPLSVRIGQRDDIVQLSH